MVTKKASFRARYVLSGEDIEKKSFEIVEALLPPLACSAAERQIVRRMVHATADPTIATQVRFHPEAVSVACEAVLRGASIYTDVRMVAMGINQRRAGRFGCRVMCALDEAGAAETGITRSAASILALGSHLDGALVAIGNAPTALFAVLDLIDSGGARPALVIGMPVGFVGAAEAKAELTKRDVPYIMVEGPRGGTPMAVAAVNALLILAEAEGEVDVL